MRNSRDLSHHFIFGLSHAERTSQKIAARLQPLLEAWTALERVPSYIEQNARLIQQESLEQFRSNLLKEP